MLRAEVGDQLVGPGHSIAHAEIVGVIIQVHGIDGRPPFTVRWYEGSSISKLNNPDPAKYWISSTLDDGEVGTALGRTHKVA